MHCPFIVWLPVCSARLRPSQSSLACFPAVSGELLQIAGGQGGQSAFACSSPQENVHLTLSPPQSCAICTFLSARPLLLAKMFRTGVAAKHAVACVMICHCQFSVKPSVACSPAKAACQGVHAVPLSLNSVQVCQTCLRCMQMITKGFILSQKQSMG